MKTFDQRVGRTPWTRYLEHRTNTSSTPTWASAADQGVRPGVRPTLRSSIRDQVFSTVRRGGQVCELPDW
jgi:hypothetical protein